MHTPTASGSAGRRTRIRIATPALRRLGAAAGACALSMSVVAAGDTANLPGPSTLATPATAADVLDATLVTGDVIRVVTQPSGVQSAIVVEDAGRPSTFASYEEDGDRYVIPDETLPYLASGAIDRELFNITGLIRAGYHDTRTDELPLLVTYEPRQGLSAARRQAGALPASVPTTLLSSIHGVAVSVDKPDAAAFWQAVAGGVSAGTTARSGDGELGSSIRKIWLDRKVEVSLDESVPQIGAPEAWAAGYDGTGVTVAVLDTGIDADHPDVASRVVASQSFIPGQTVADGHGHGTHVASILSGSGAASDGQYVGVAPGTDLLVGKVLSNAGTGTASQVIAGMEWAAIEMDADVVSMSLGTTSPSDGTDPQSEAVNQLTAQTGALFVIAGGNNGPAPETIGAPGAATSALTVGSVDKNEQLAASSSRGPRLGDGAVKPNITGPGVGIVAARAAGTSLGSPVNDYYTSASGTSMATPHVAGAAAILAQQHPDWEATELKQALVSSAVPAELSVFQQGAGRVDVAKAIGQQVVAEQVALSFGTFSFPQDELEPVTQSVSYRNDGDEPVTLSLAADVAAPDGQPAPEGMMILSASESEVPAGSTAGIEVTVDPRLGPAGIYSGYVQATTADGTVAVGTPVGFVKEAELHNLHIDCHAPELVPNVCLGVLENADSIATFRTTVSGGSAGITVPVPPGTYTFYGRMQTAGGDFGSRFYTFLEPEIVVAHEDVNIAIESDGAQRIEVQTPQAGVLVTETERLQRVDDEGTHASLTSVYSPFVERYVIPSAATKGEFWYSNQRVLVQNPIDARIKGPGGRSLHPRYGLVPPDAYGANDYFVGNRHLEVLYAGLGEAEDFEGRDAAGKLVLLEVQGGDGIADITRRLPNAEDAGAALVAFYAPIGGGLGPVISHDTRGSSTLPHVMLPPGEGAMLRDLAEDGDVMVMVRGRSDTPYRYNLQFEHRGGLPDNVDYVVPKRQLTTIDTTYHSPLPQFNMTSTANTYYSPLGETGGFFIGSSLVRRPNVTEYFFSTDENVVGSRIIRREGPYPGTTTIYAHAQQEYEQYPRGERKSEHWFDAPARPGASQWESNATREELMRRDLTDSDGLLCRACRTADRFYPNLTTAHPGGHSSSLPTSRSYRLYQGDELLSPERDSASRTYYPMAPAGADYRLELDTQARITGDFPTHTETVWTFASERPPADKQLPPGFFFYVGTEPHRLGEAQPLIDVNYQMDQDATNRVSARSLHGLELTAGHRQESSTQAAVTEFSVRASFDDGAQWRRVPVWKRGGGDYVALLWVPPLSQTNGSISLRVHAEDAEGNTIDQTITRAYGLR